MVPLQLFASSNPSENIHVKFHVRIHVEIFANLFNNKEFRVEFYVYFHVEFPVDIFTWEANTDHRSFTSSTGMLIQFTPGSINCTL